jgi:uncharacterized OB-fold protein
MKKRVGVFVCDCGTNIASVVDTEKVAEYARQLPGVVYSTTYKYMCSDPGQELVRNAIQEQGLEQVVIASCSPRMHEKTFRKAVEAGGINPYMFEMVNIREQDSWVHPDREEATNKAMDLVRMGVSKVLKNVPLQVSTIPITKKAMVIGGGIAGMQTALDIAEAGPQDKILFINYGEGSDAIVFQVTDAILKLSPRRGVRGHINTKKSEMTYGKYLIWKEMIETEPLRRPPLVRPSLPDRYRNQKKILGFYGSKCTECGTPQFPASRVCIHCKAIDKYEEYRFYGKKGIIATYTVDYLAATPDPPTIMAVVDYEGGGRFVCLMTDCDPDKVRVGMEVELSFRKLFTQDGLVTYFWKAIPPR